MGIFDKAKDLVGDNADKIEDGIDQVAEMAKDKVPEAHGDKVDMVADKAKDVVEGLSEDDD